MIGFGSGDAGNGVYGRAFGSDVSGVYGYHPATGQGVRGVAAGAGTGVYGNCNHTTGVGGDFTNRASVPGAGIRGESGPGTAATVQAARSKYDLSFAGGEFAGRSGVIAVAADNAGCGVIGVGPGANGSGIAGYADGGDSAVSGAHTNGSSGALGLAGFGLFAAATPGGVGVGAFDAGAESNSLAIFAQGNVQVTGALSKAGGSFKIDHRSTRRTSTSITPSSNHPRCSTSTAAPWNWTPTAGPRSPCRTGSMRSTATSATRSRRSAHRHPDLHISAPFADSRFAIAGGPAGLQVSWQVTGVRRDAWAQAHRIPVEETKAADERGRYLHPELIGPHPKPVPIVPVTSATVASTAAL